MQDNQTPKQGFVRLYACGGCGVNIGDSLLASNTDQTLEGFADLDVTFIDTSRSNTRSHINHDSIFFIPDVDGSGKVRSENYTEINKQILKILQDFKPGDLSIVLHSGAGGSGSVIGPLLVSELISKGRPVLSIVVGGLDTRLEMENTLKTIKSYESISLKNNTPVIAFYVENSGGLTRPKVDGIVRSAVTALRVLYSGQNREMDSKDLLHWLHYDKTTTFKPQLVTMVIEKGSKAALTPQEMGNIISLATLADDPTKTRLDDVVPDYQIVGYVGETVTSILATSREQLKDSNDNVGFPLHFITCDGIFPNVAKVLSTKLATLEELQRARVPTNPLLTQHDKAQDSGLIL